jgi:hypothetical protein
MIRQYVETALHKARYEKLRDGTFYGEVPRLRGVLATGASLEACRDQLAEVVERQDPLRFRRRTGQEHSRARPSRPGQLIATPGCEC